MPTSSIRLDIESACAFITFDRPQTLNAIDSAGAHAFGDAIARIAANPRIRAVMLRGAGRAFMAGGDVSAIRAAPQAIGPALIDPLHAALSALARLPVPVLACVHGAVAGAGLSILLAADLAIAADDSRFTLAYARIGASPDASATWHLPRIVGLRKAMELALLCEPLDARQALQLSIVNRVVPAAELQTQAVALLRQLADGPTDALGRTKALLRASLSRSLEGQLDAERAAFLAGAGTQDFREGLDAFLEKRPPVFIGR
ncbi:enoyl-CoA hydratase-related protein [Castellaniella ginsengisoli]|uniref:Enoyl-CoA hydratase-related protein n=1 Tax=Castellaniella ginsengisoli TaxID=546114 RepID=A0AB39GJV7_9BURK